MLEKLAKAYVLLILIIYPVITLFSLFGFIPFFPVNFLIMGLGLLTISCIALCSICNKYISISLSDYLIVLSFIWFFSVIVLHYNIYSYTEDGRYISAIRYYSPFFIVSLCCYFIFKKSVSFFITSRSIYYLFLMYFSLSIITIQYFDIKTFKIDFSRIIDPSFIGVYQIVSDSLAFTVISILTLSKAPKMLKVSIIIITLFFLLILNARSGLIGFLLALIFIFKVRRYFIKKPIYIISIVLIIICAIFVSIPNIHFLSSFFENYNSRIYNIFSGNFSDDASFLGRMKLLLHSFSIIAEHPLLGYFGSQANIDIDGFGVRWGAYTHNIFVYWDQFGIIGFSLIGLIILMSIYSNHKLKENVGIDLFPLIILVMSQQVFLKSFTYFYLFAMAGLIEGVKYVSKHNHNHKKLK